MRLSDEVISVLKRMEVTGNQTVMPQLDRKLYTSVNQALEMLGGKWNRSARSHVWDCDPNDALESAVMTGEVLDWKKEFQFFETPPELAARMVDLAGIADGNGERVLEPSAGKGAILQFIRNRRVTAVELNEKLCVILRHHYSNAFLVHGDFLECSADLLGKFDAIVMNPPFNSGKFRDVDHVRHAYDFLNPGGKLVSVTGPGWTFRSDRKHEEFRAWLHAAGCDVHEELPEGTFADSGTNVRTMLIRIEKR